MRGQKRRLAALAMALALLFPMAGAGESAATAVEENPEEMGEFALPSPEGDGAPPVAQTPAPTLPPPTAEPDRAFHTSINYPESKVSFEDEIWGILTGRWGLSDFQAAGLMGSIRAESGFCPYNVERVEGVDDRGKYAFRTGDSVGFGLCQWTAPRRKARLRALAESRGDPALVWDFDVQMEFMRGELDLDALRGMESLYEACEWVTLWYERPSQAYANSWPGTRYRYALEIYAAHAGREYEEPPARFAVYNGGAALHSSDTVWLAWDALPGERGGALTVRSSLYWRLEVADARPEGWLEPRCAGLYDPKDTVICRCGYACEGEKPVELAVLQAPPIGQTYSATLRFELFGRESRFAEVPVTLTNTGLRTALALIGAGLEIAGFIQELEAVN